MVEGKKTLDAFHSTALDYYLRANEIEYVVFTGHRKIQADAQSGRRAGAGGLYGATCVVLFRPGWVERACAVRQDADREFKPLALVDAHHAHHVC